MTSQMVKLIFSKKLIKEVGENVLKEAEEVLAKELGKRKKFKDFKTIRVYAIGKQGTWFSGSKDEQAWEYYFLPLVGLSKQFKHDDEMCQSMLDADLGELIDDDDELFSDEDIPFGQDKEQKESSRVRKYTAEYFKEKVVEKPSDFIVGEKTGKPIEKVVDKILKHFLFTQRSFQSGSKKMFCVLPFQFCGYSFEEMTEEFKVRGFEVNDTRSSPYKINDKRDWLCIQC